LFDVVAAALVVPGRLDDGKEFLGVTLVDPGVQRVVVELVRRYPAVSKR